MSPAAGAGAAGVAGAARPPQPNNNNSNNKNSNNTIQYFDRGKVQYLQYRISKKKDDAIF